MSQVMLSTFIYRALLKYSNRTYTCTQNTIIEQSFSISINKGWITEGLAGILYLEYIYIYTTPVVEIKSAMLWYITDISRFVATLTIYGVTSHIPRNPYLNSKQVSNNKRLNQPTIIYLSNF